MKTVPPHEKLERLYEEHAQALFAFLLSLTRDESDTRDALQEVFFKLARQPEVLDSAKDERAFLVRLAHNAAIDLMRRREARTRYQDKLSREPVALFAPCTDPDGAAFRTELSAAMGHLPPEQRAVVHLKLWEGLTFEEIGEEGIKEEGMEENTLGEDFGEEFPAEEKEE